MMSTMVEKRENGYAVSPIVGVMLMLVVTIIIAAVVSAFAGGLGSESKKTPQMTFNAKYSQSNGLTILHTGGDTLPTADLSVWMTPTSTFTTKAEFYSYQISIANITNSQNIPWGSGSTEVTSFAGGESAFVTAQNMSCTVLQPQTGTYTYHCIDNPNNLGKTINIKLVDKNSNVIAKQDITIQA